jgi:hypothetical protein
VGQPRFTQLPKIDRGFESRSVGRRCGFFSLNLLEALWKMIIPQQICPDPPQNVRLSAIELGWSWRRAIQPTAN